ncbi:probable E3 ubiquitin-protein ligase RNF217 [Chenopodium quinoa]|nr:probable E3 ubiquitin-protein ligase RNF217 [Chenopodium quinoa]
MAHHHSSTRNNIKEEHDEDDDCIFVKEVTNSMSKSKGKQKIIEPKQESKYFESTNFRKNISTVNVDGDEYDDDVTIINVTPRPSSRPLSSSLSPCSSSKKRKLHFSCPTIVEVGESSKSKEKNDEICANNYETKEVTFVCDICTDSKPQQESFLIKGCSHYYCVDCVRNYVDSKLEGGVSQIDCPVPKCSGTLDPEHCREILIGGTFFKWGILLCESTIVASQKFYCPFKDCSALLIDDGSKKVTRSECPSCYRLFCAQCRVGWHEGLECAKFQTLNKDEREAEGRMLMNLAEDNNWKRCPACKIYVEKTMGCNIMRCR